MDVEAIKARGAQMGLKAPRATVEMLSSRPKRVWGTTRRGSLKPGDVVAGEGMVHEVKDGKYTHEVLLRIGEGPRTCWSRPEAVYAFSEANKED